MCPGKSVNTFGQPVMAGAESRWSTNWRSGPICAACCSRAASRANSSPGPISTSSGALAYSTKEQVLPAWPPDTTVFTGVSRLPFPTVALIDGNCMGGGTEITLAMDYRLAAANPATKIGLPEVKVGIIPGWGGTQRLPRVVGVQQAITMITSGEPIGATEAAKCGLVFDAVPPANGSSKRVAG